MSRKSTLKNLKKERKPSKSEKETVIVSDAGDEMEPIYAPIKNSREAKPIVSSAGIISYKVNDIKVQFQIYQMDIYK